MPRTIKTIISLFQVALLGLTATAVAQTKIRLATLLPRGSSHFQVLEAMAQQWKSASGGSITLAIYPDGTMGDEPDIVRRMRNGQIQMATLSAGLPSGH